MTQVFSQSPNMTLLLSVFLFAQLSACGDSLSTTKENNGQINLVLDAGNDQITILSDSLSLTPNVTENGVAAQSNITYQWTMQSGPGTANFATPTNKNTSVTFSSHGSYVLKLNADNGSNQTSDIVDITVNVKAAGVGGLSARPTNVGECIAPASPPVASSIQLDTPFPNLPRLSSSLAMYMAPGASDFWYVVQQSGQIIKFANNASVSSVSTFIDIADSRLESGGEKGLLGMAFHPDFSNNGYVYLSYTNNESGLKSRISRFNLDNSGQALDPASEQILLSVDQPYGNHNGGQIAFGPEDYLYIGLGDGGSGGDPQGHGQNTTTLLGAMLRIDVGDGSSTTYNIPSDNPFVTSGGRAEIYAYGLRNPWRWSFDMSDGTLWAGDVGQNAYEEINILGKGNNYGWNTMEATHCYNASSCDQTGLTLPVAEYDHSQGYSVTGGYVYRGTNIDFLAGQYLYGDYVTGRIWGLEEVSPNQYTATELLDTSINIASFAQDQDGEIYVVDLSGYIYKIGGNSGYTVGQVPSALSDWGCFQSGDIKSFSNAVIPFDINALLWTDDANKSRFIAIPDGTSIDIDNEGRFEFPPGSVIGKHFRLNNQLIETRLMLHHQAPHGWKGYSYEWNGAETDATLLTGAKDQNINSQVWHFPSSAECDACHTSVVGFTIGPEVGQLNRTLTYPGSGTTANQLITLESINAFTNSLTDIEKSTAFYAIDDSAYSAQKRARSYLHSNCAGCHQPGGPGGGNIDLRMATALTDTRICNTAPFGDTFGLNSPTIVSPGNPDASILVLRMETLGPHRMPPLGSAIVDTEAVTVIRDWITNLTTCP